MTPGQRTRPDRPPRARRRSPDFRIERLESRVLLSLFSAVDPGGMLSVRGTADEAIVVTAADGQVKVNGQDPSTGPFAAGAITAINITGGPENNTVDLSGVTEGLFPALSDGTVSVSAGVGEDTVIGTALADSLAGDFGDDSVIGGAGDDTLGGGDGADTLEGSTGIDVFSERLTSVLAFLSDTGFIGEDSDVLGGIEQASLTGTGAGDNIDASLFTGRTTIDGGGGSDVVLGGTNNDSLVGGAGNDSMDGGAGNDTLRGDSGNDLLLGGDGNDDLSGGFGRNRASGEAGVDVIDFSDAFGRGGRGANIRLRADGSGTGTAPVARTVFRGIEGVIGTAFRDVIVSTLTEGATVMGGRGDDRIRVTSGANLVDGGQGNDRIHGGDGNDTLLGGAGKDRLFGGSGTDWMDGESGNDRLRKRSGSATLIGNDGDDRILGGSGDESIDGGVGNDRIRRGAGVDTVDGGLGKDTVDGIVG